MHENLLSIIDSYESLVDQISDYSFVAQEINVDNYFIYSQQLAVLMLELAQKARNFERNGNRTSAIESLELATIIGKELLYNTVAR